MDSWPLEKARFDADELKQLTDSLNKLGFPRQHHKRILESLICVAEEHRPLIISASRAHRISHVRHDLQKLAEHLRDGTELLTPISVEAWNAILGRYPASTFDINIFAEGHLAELPNQFAEEPLALPLDIAASQDIISNALGQPLAHPFVHLHWDWHDQDEILEKFLRLEKLSTWTICTKKNASKNGRPVPSPTSELLTGRLRHLIPEERTQLLIVVEWAIGRVNATCVPKSRPNTGKRTTFQWANGFLDRILAANVISALWPENLPERLSSRIVAEVVDVVKGKLSDTRDSVEITHVTHILWLLRQHSAHEATLSRLFGEMETLNQINVGLNRKLIELPEFRSQDCSLSVQNSRKQIKSSIRKNLQRINNKDEEYAALTASLREIKRRLRSGDYQPPSRGRIPKITGSALKIKALDIG
jgi:hypothetical protein